MKRLSTRATCRNGHPRTAVSVYKDGQCKLCHTARAQRWRMKHAQADSAYNKQWKHDHAKEERARQAHWRKTHPANRRASAHKRLARIRGCVGAFTASEWTALIVSYSCTCLCCGQRKVLTPDHVISLSKGGSNDIGNIQPLCRKCNERKGVKYTDYRLDCINPS